jgi:hypothetical protein
VKSAAVAGKARVGFYDQSSSLRTRRSATSSSSLQEIAAVDVEAIDISGRGTAAAADEATGLLHGEGHGTSSSSKRSSIDGTPSVLIRPQSVASDDSNNDDDNDALEKEAVVHPAQYIVRSGSDEAYSEDGSVVPLQQLGIESDDDHDNHDNDGSTVLSTRKKSYTRLSMEHDEGAMSTRSSISLKKRNSSSSSSSTTHFVQPKTVLQQRRRRTATTTATTTATATTSQAEQLDDSDDSPLPSTTSVLRYAEGSRVARNFTRSADGPQEGSSSEHAHAGQAAPLQQLHQHRSLIGVVSLVVLVLTVIILSAVRFMDQRRITTVQPLIGSQGPSLGGEELSMTIPGGEELSMTIPGGEELSMTIPGGEELTMTLSDSSGRHAYIDVITDEGNHSGIDHVDHDHDGDGSAVINDEDNHPGIDDHAVDGGEGDGSVVITDDDNQSGIDGDDDEGGSAVINDEDNRPGIDRHVDDGKGDGSALITDDGNQTGIDDDHAGDNGSDVIIYEDNRPEIDRHDDDGENEDNQSGIDGGDDDDDGSAVITDEGNQTGIDHDDDGEGDESVGITDEGNQTGIDNHGEGDDVSVVINDEDNRSGIDGHHAGDDGIVVIDDEDDHGEGEGDESDVITDEDNQTGIDGDDGSVVINDEDDHGDGDGEGDESDVITDEGNQTGIDGDHAGDDGSAVIGVECLCPSCESCIADADVNLESRSSIAADSISALDELMDGLRKGWYSTQTVLSTSMDRDDESRRDIEGSLLQLGGEVDELEARYTVARSEFLEAEMRDSREIDAKADQLQEMLQSATTTMMSSDSPSSVGDSGEIGLTDLLNNNVDALQELMARIIDPSEVGSSNGNDSSSSSSSSGQLDMDALSTELLRQDAIVTNEVQSIAQELGTAAEHINVLQKDLQELEAIVSSIQRSLPSDDEDGDEPSSILSSRKQQQQLLGADLEAAVSSSVEEEVQRLQQSDSKHLPDAATSDVDPGVDELVDYAVGPRGGKVMSPRQKCPANNRYVLTSPPVSSLHHHHQPLHHDHSHRKWVYKDQRILVSHHRPIPEHFYATRPTDGAVTVLMHTLTNVSYVQLLHASYANYFGINSTVDGCVPKMVRLSGWTVPPTTTRDISTTRLELGEFQAALTNEVEGFDELKIGDQGPVHFYQQTFPLATHPSTASTSIADSFSFPLPPLRAITISVLSNHGGDDDDDTAAAADYSCIHRIRVVGSIQL